MTIRGSLARCRVRLLRSWWTIALPFVAVGGLALWRFGSGWLASFGAVGCLLCLVVLLMVATIGGSEVVDGFEGGGEDGPGGGDGGGD